MNLNKLDKDRPFVDKWIRLEDFDNIEHMINFYLICYYSKGW